ncbi:MAG: oligoendopeptidase F [Verrucomicrobia bacterium]|nr:MAG: oligoendopeptidase F [Verrucomicrobia bacterium 13_1_40CM_4_54_4]PYJ76995.1 MAG: oligoendopeptidase F [Verrucomicrobiota bacterium]
MNEAKIPTRAEILESDKWDLTQLFADVSKWQEDFSWLQRTYPKLQDWKGRVGESAKALVGVLEFEKSLELKIERVYHYASLQLAEDSANNEYLARIGQVQNLLTKIGEAAAFVVPEIQAIDDETFAKFIVDPVLAEWRIKLHKIRRLKPHVLSEPEERLLALGSVALSGYDDTFSQLTDVDMKFGLLTDETGRERPLTQSSFSSFLVKRDHELRKRAFHQFYAEFQDHQYTLAASLAYSVKADVFRAGARNYSSALEAALFPDDVSVGVYNGLIKSVRANLKPLFRYFDLRRRALGLRELHHHDTYVPLVPEIEARTSFDQAVEMVLGALAPLGKEYVDVLAEGLRGRWCDRYETKGKRSGAFSSGSYGAPPYILMNYKDDVFADVYTLAHEAGHSMHSWFSQNSQRFQDYEYPIFLAEVASTFNEELLTHHLLEETSDPKMRAYIINRQIDDLRGTLFRQTMFAEFEKIIHAIEESGDALTLDVFKSEYHKLLETYFAKNFVLDPELDLECLRIPHFYHAFYVYKYATGISAAVALSERMLSGESGSVAAYINFLRSGGSKFPLETLQAAGVDMTTPAPIESTLRLFERRLDNLEALLL